MASKNKKTKSSQRVKAVMDMVKALQTVFDSYTIKTREDAWKNITSAKAEKEMTKLLKNPTRSISSFKNIGSFKEWLDDFDIT